MVTFTIINTGNGTAFPTWYDYIYAAKNFSVSSSKWKYLTYARHNQHLAAGEHYNVTKYVTIPKDYGNYFLGVYTDNDYNQVHEVNGEGNNLKMVSLIILITNLINSSST